jgi:hypothetical protein
MNSAFRSNLVCFLGAMLFSFGGAWWLNDRPDDSRQPDSSLIAKSVQEEAAPAKQEEAPKFPPAEDLVKDWQKPDVCLFISGELHGYIEPCGCTGLANQKGGLLRRHTAQKILEQRGWDLIPIDTGNVIRRIGKQPQLQLEMVYQSLSKVMGYPAISISHEDLKTSGTDLAQIMINSFENQNPFVSCNVVVLDESLINPFRIIEKNGKKIGLTSVLSNEHRGVIKDTDIKTVSAEDGLKKVIPQLQAAKCDLLVLIADASLEESRALAKQFPVFDVMVTTGGAGDPTLLPEPIVSERHITQMIQVGVKGMHAGLVALYTNPKKEVKYERVPMDARFDDSEEIKVQFQTYQDRLKLLYENPANFPDIAPRNHTSGHEFVGTAACQECHEKEYDVWLNGVDGAEGEVGPHSRATRDLTDPGERTWVKRNFDPECLSCHVTGWNAQNFFPYKSGYLDLQKDVVLHGNGCENCHGPASAHVVAENKEKPAAEDVQKKLRKEMRVTMKQAREGMCMECHDLDNSPDFFKPGAFDEYWKKIKH